MQIVVYVISFAVQKVGKLLLVHCDVMPCAVAVPLAFVGHIGFVIVPIEEGLVLFLQGLQELLFHFLQHIEAYEDVSVVFEIDVFVCCDFAINRSFITNALFFKAFVV